MDNLLDSSIEDFGYSAAPGTLYGVSVGPGAPDLVTLRAARVLRSVDVVAAPALASGKRTALGIVAGLVEGKTLLDCSTPMTRDRVATARAYDAIADELAARLDDGHSVAFITLGDASVYSTWSYVHERMASRGYRVEVVPGVPSFCAAAARLGEPLCTGDEQLLVVPTSAGDPQAALGVPGVKVFMKAGRSLADLQELLREQGAQAQLVANCGLEGELVVRDFLQMQDTAGYMAVVIARDGASAAARGECAGEGNAADGAVSAECAVAGDGVDAEHAESAGEFATAPQAGSSFFQNRACPYFPCHEGIDEAHFNCLMCYCPLYALGDRCGGAFRYTGSGVKDCSSCTMPHRGVHGVQLVKEKFEELSALAASTPHDSEASHG